MGGLADPEKPLNLISHRIPTSSCNPSNIEPIVQTEDFFDEMNPNSAVEIDNAYRSRGEPGGAKAQKRTIQLGFRS